MLTTSHIASALLTLALSLSLGACDGGSGTTPTDGGPLDGGAAGTSGGAADTSSGQTISFLKDGARANVDFGKWGTPAYYQETAAGWTLAVVANEVSGALGRYFSLMVRETDGNELVPGAYPCAAEPGGPKVTGQITYAEGGMAKLWKQAAGSPCTITVDEIGALGAHLKGTFSATLKATQGATEDVVLADGVFDVVRKKY